MRQLTSADFESFILANPVAAICFDAEWDVSYGPAIRRAMLEAENALGEQVSFGEVDCDRNPELAKSMSILNVPSVAYYRDGRLIDVLIGVQQNVRARLERLLTLAPER